MYLQVQKVCALSRYKYLFQEHSMPLEKHQTGLQKRLLNRLLVFLFPIRIEQLSHLRRFWEIRVLTRAPFALVCVNCGKTLFFDR